LEIIRDRSNSNKKITRVDSGVLLFYHKITSIYRFRTKGDCLSIWKVLISPPIGLKDLKLFGFNKFISPIYKNNVRDGDSCLEQEKKSVI
jgi:hypothetical protein